MGAIPYNDTPVVESTWDGPGEVAKIPNDAGADVLRRMYAWVDSNGNQDAKASYKFPHHRVDNGSPGPAVSNGIRIGLSRIPRADIPAGDREGVRSHLQRHLDKLNAAAPEPGRAATAGAWAIMESYLPLVARFEHGKVLAGADVEAIEAFGMGPEDPPAAPGVAVVPLRGILRAGGLLSMLFGNPLDRFRQAFDAAVGNKDVNAIVLDVNSPGGSTDLIPELAADVRAARGTKPIVAVANTLAASAAYWIASQADEVVVTPSGEVGSIGVFAVHEDISVAAEMEGVNITLISAGKFKVEGNPFEPLTDEARQAIQAGVDDFYSMFVNDVAKGRDVRASDVRSGFGEGRALTARRAVDEGLADRVATRDETVARLSNARRRARVGSEDDAANRAMLWHDLQLARER